MSHNTAYSGRQDPINCPANQPDPRTKKTSEQEFPPITPDLPTDGCVAHPAPTQEPWTVEQVKAMMLNWCGENDGYQIVASRHNAALAAERETVRLANKIMESDRLAIADRDEQLAAVKEIIKATPIAHLINPVRERLLAKIGGKP
jgi:hypothetical protein